MIYAWINGWLECRQRDERERRSKVVHTLAPRLEVGLGSAGLGLGCTISLPSKDMEESRLPKSMTECPNKLFEENRPPLKFNFKGLFSSINWSLGCPIFQLMLKNIWAQPFSCFIRWKKHPQKISDQNFDFSPTHWPFEVYNEKFQICNVKFGQNFSMAEKHV